MRATASGLAVKFLQIDPADQGFLEALIEGAEGVV